MADKQPSEPRIRHERDHLKLDQTGTHQREFGELSSGVFGGVAFQH
jgi:hypothetical protein